MSDLFKPADFNSAIVRVGDGEYMPRHVVCAANKFEDGTIILGIRHWDGFMHNSADSLGLRRIHNKCDQGFVDQWGNFMSRDEALQVVRANGQHTRLPLDKFDTLYSENLY